MEDSSMLRNRELRRASALAIGCAVVGSTSAAQIAFRASLAEPAPGLWASGAPVGNQVHAIVDWDEDGTLDLLLLADSNLRFVRGLGRGAFAPSVRISELGSYVGRNILRFHAGDIDGDGDADLFGTGNDRVWSQENLGRGALGPAVALSSMPSGSYGPRIAIADLDGDGTRDLWIGVQIFRQNARWSFAEIVGAVPPGFYVDEFSLADLDGDGDVDAAGDWGVIALNDGTGRFQVPPLPHFAPSIPRGYYAPLIADLDGTGGLQMAFIGEMQAIHLYRREANYIWNDETSLSTWPASRYNHFRHVAAADFDGDGRSDLLLARQGGPLEGFTALALMQNLGAGRFQERTRAWIPGVELRGGLPLVADWDGNGTPDLVFLRTTADAQVFRNDGSGRLLTTQRYAVPSGTPSFYMAFAADLDRDGAAEVLLPRGPLALLQNDGVGRFEHRGSEPFPAGIDGVVGVTSLDFDRDGALDLLLSVNGQSRALRNLGGLRFADETSSRLPVLTDATNEILAFDADGDGFEDLLLVNSSSTPYNGRVDRLLRNDGQGRFASSPRLSLPAHAEQTAACVAADFDGDRDVDLFCLRFGGASLLLNDGTGMFAFAPASALPPNGIGSMQMKAGDLDGDGDFDVFVPLPTTLQSSGAYVGGSEVYRNDGRGSFHRLIGAVPLAATSFGHHWPGVVTLADLDGDLDLDAVEPGSPLPRVLLNRGDATFTTFAQGAAISQDPRPAPGFDEQATAVDLDRDGDLDLLWTNRGTNEGATVYALYNLSRQLAIPRLLAVGENLEVDLHFYASPADRWVPLVSIASHPLGLALPPHGHLFLDAFGLVVLPPRPLVYGTSRHVLGRLSDPDWTRHPLHVQAALLPDPNPSTWRFSNLASTIVLP
jgi:hypothetical protein